MAIKNISVCPMDIYDAETVGVTLFRGQLWRLLSIWKYAISMYGQ